MKLSIGELEQLTGMSRATLRYYDGEGLLQPERQENGYRVYSSDDIMSLVQLKQLNALGVGLSEMPNAGNRRGCPDIHASLVAQQQAIEQEIDDLYQKLSRLRLHVDAYRHCMDQLSDVQEGRMLGVYRIYFSSLKNADARTIDIFRRWMNGVPDTYSAVRIPQKALSLPPSESCAADTGLGLLSGAFRRLNEVFEPPIEYSPPCKCLSAMVETPSLAAVPCEVLEPFRKYIDAHGLIPIGDFYGWVVYTPANRKSDTYRLSLRIEIH